MPDAQEDRIDRPKDVGTARTLSVIAGVLWLPIVGSLSIFVAGVAVLCYVVGSFGAARGIQPARITVTAALAMSYLFLLPYCFPGFNDESLYATAYAGLDIIAVALSATSLVLLYRPSSNRYFHLTTIARRAR